MRYGKMLMFMVTLLLGFLWGMQADAGGRIKKIPAPVPQTGQTLCYDEYNYEIPCEGTGHDGDHQAGVPWPNPRFTDRGDGTVRDNLTGLIWLRNANCFGARTWTEALNDCNTLASGTCGLMDDSQAGDWRLPNAFELVSLIDLGFYNPALSNTAGTGQWSQGNPFLNVVTAGSCFYFTSTSYILTTEAWTVPFSSGGLVDMSKAGHFYVWPVRDAQ